MSAVPPIPVKVTDFIDGLDDSQKAEFAAMVLAETDASKNVCDAFFDKLKSEDETVHDELCSRAADRLDCEDEESESGGPAETR